MSKAKIIPAILSDELADFGQKLASVRKFARTVHLDLADGQFVPNETLTAAEMLSLTHGLEREIHLMVWRPLEVVNSLALESSDRVAIHIESELEPGQLISYSQSAPCLVAVALNPETELRPVLPVIEAVGRVLVLGVHPGFQGAQFLPTTFDRIAEIHRQLPQVEITADGGLNDLRLAQAVKAGASRLVVGSAIWSESRPADVYSKLVKSIS